MAKVIKTDTEPQSISTAYSWWKVALVGTVLGIIYWGFASLISVYFDSVVISGNIATILVATSGILVMMRLNMAQPLIIAVATGASLWGLAQLTRGLSAAEAIAWSVALYGVAYVLFSWIARYIKPVPVLTAMAIVTIAARIAANL